MHDTVAYGSMHTDVLIINSAKSSNFEFLLGTLPKVLSFVVTSGILEGCSDIVKVVAEDYALELSIFVIQQLA